MTSIARAGPANTVGGAGHSKSSSKDLVSGGAGYITGVGGQISQSP